VKQKQVKALTDKQLEDVGVWVLQEIRHRHEQRKRKAMAEIKAIASEHGLSVTPVVKTRKSKTSRRV
jgi:hypothetical protein